eukprot:TRINITY_DN5190_c0_g1_i2.p1 TRINITY_DN5190_c0_g1~~TRINITY_DN5190_c0_g1_i2.p1  ORF type:complete len:1076 (+),score=84.23 TRINITY_DN5190_c0_g1_i2:35-3229(+)
MAMGRLRAAALALGWVSASAQATIVAADAGDVVGEGSSGGAALEAIVVRAPVVGATTPPATVIGSKGTLEMDDLFAMNVEVPAPWTASAPQVLPGRETLVDGMINLPWTLNTPRFSASRCTFATQGLGGPINAFKTTWQETKPGDMTGFEFVRKARDDDSHGRNTADRCGSAHDDVADRLVVGDHGGYLDIYDVSNACRLTYVETTDLASGAVTCAVTDVVLIHYLGESRAYAACGDEGIVISTYLTAPTSTAPTRVGVNRVDALTVFRWGSGLTWVAAMDRDAGMVELWDVASGVDSPMPITFVSDPLFNNWKDAAAHPTTDGVVYTCGPGLLRWDLFAQPATYDIIADVSKCHSIVIYKDRMYASIGETVYVVDLAKTPDASSTQSSANASLVVSETATMSKSATVPSNQTQSSTTAGVSVSETATMSKSATVPSNQTQSSTTAGVSVSETATMSESATVPSNQTQSSTTAGVSVSATATMSDLVTIPSIPVQSSTTAGAVISETATMSELATVPSTQTQSSTTPGVSVSATAAVSDSETARSQSSTTAGAVISETATMSDSETAHSAPTQSSESAHPRSTSAPAAHRAPQGISEGQRETLNSLGTWTAAAGGGGLGAVRGLGCDVDDVDLGLGVPLDFEFSPTGLALGAGRMRYLVGAVVANVGVVVVTAAVMVGAARCAPVGGAGASMNQRLAALRAPGLLLIPYVFLLPGTCLAAGRILFAGGPVTVPAYGVSAMGLLVCCASPCILYRTVVGKVGAKARLVDDPRLGAPGSDGAMAPGRRRVVYRFVFGEQIWVSSGRESYFADKMGVVFDSYRAGLQHMLIVEVLMSLLLCFLAAIRPGRGPLCHSRNTAICLMFFAWLVAVVKYPPFLAPLQNYWTQLIAVCNAGALLLMTLAIALEENGVLSEIAGVLLIHSALLTMGRGVYDVGAYTLDLYIQRRSGAWADARRGDVLMDVCLQEGSLCSEEGDGDPFACATTPRVESAAEMSYHSPVSPTSRSSSAAQGFSTTSAFRYLPQGQRPPARVQALSLASLPSPKSAHLPRTPPSRRSRAHFAPVLH